MPTRLLAVPVLALLMLVSSLRAGSDAAADAARAAIEAVLRSMEKAVLAGDAEGYLANIATDDAVFLQEQRMWAADLKRHVPTIFSLRVIDPAERQANEEATTPAGTETAPAGDADYPHEFSADRGIFELEMKWEVTVPLADGEKGEPDHLDRNVSYPVEFVRSGDRWLFKGEHWVSVAMKADGAAGTDPDDANATRPPAPAKAAESVHRNIVMCFPGYEELAERVAEVLPEVRAHVDEGFEGDVPHTQVVKIYPTMRHLQSSIYLSYVDGLSGWNEPKEAIKILGRPNATRASLRTLLSHEYGHVATFELGPKATDIAWWALEGVAELSSEGFRARGRRDTERRVQKWSTDDKLVEFAIITDFRNTPKQAMGHVYTQGHHMVGYISDRFGRTRRNAWFRAMANGVTIDDATRTVLGLAGGFAQLDTDWRAELRSPATGEEP